MDATGNKQVSSLGRTKYEPVSRRRSTRASQRKLRLHVVSNTHWDREHRHGLQETRCMLVEMMDRLLEIFRANPDFKHFVLDGQSVPLEDYLEIRPDRRDEIKSLVQAGRLHIGPWYTLPDMHAVNGECIVRNLLMGDSLCNKFGPKMMFGYSIFSFGQIAQLPQIYKGFDIRDAIVYKRFSPRVFPKSEFVWVAPDGSEILASRLGKLFRVNFMFCFTIPVLLGGDALKPGWSADFRDNTRLGHMIDPAFRNQYATEMEPDIHIREGHIEKAIRDVLASVDETAGEYTRLAFDGVDFSYPLREMPEAIRLANQIMGDEVEILHSTPVDYVQELRKELNLQSLLRYTGEIRFGPMSAVHCESLSANVDLKQRNLQAENQLLYYAEPFSTFGMIGGGAYPEDLLKHGWKYLLKAQAHDSIHGTGVPKIKRDVLFRLEQTQEIAESITRRAFQGITRRIDTSGVAKDAILITVFNPSPHPRTETMQLQLDLPPDEHISEYHLESMDGERIAHYEYGSAPTEMASVNGENRPKSVHCDRRQIDAFLPDIPAYGYRTFRVSRTKNGRQTGEPFARPVYPYKPIAQKPNVLDNGLLRVEVLTNGTLQVQDRTTDQIYSGLHVLTDEGCAGDLWIHKPPQNARAINTLAALAEVSILPSSNLRGTLRIALQMDLPESLSQDRKSRSHHTVRTQIVTDLSLTRNSRRLEIKTTLDNQVRDHRLTVRFDTGVRCEVVHSDNPFEIRSRAADVAEDNGGTIDEEVVLRQPMHSFVDVSDSRRGFTLMTRGIKEFESWTTQDRTVHLELTLLRAVTQTIPIHNEVHVDFGSDEPSQCIGTHVFEYALYFHEKSHEQGGVAEARRYHTPLAAMQYGRGTGTGILPLELSFLEVSHPNTLVNCVKKAVGSDEIVVRLTNPTASPITETLRFYHSIQTAWVAKLNEHKTEGLVMKDPHTLPIELPPYRIVTLVLTVSS